MFGRLVGGLAAGTFRVGPVLPAAVLERRYRQHSATLETTFHVQGVSAERIGRPARAEVMEEVARVTRGKVIGADKIDDVIRSLADLPDPPSSVRRVQLWSNPILATALIVLMGVFWVGRMAPVPARLW